MAEDFSALEQLASESFYKAPTVVIITGNTNRRFHALSVCADTLAVHGHSVDCLSFSLDEKELNALKKYQVSKIKPYSFHVFKELYKAHEAPSRTKSFILIEMDVDLLKKFAFADHKVRTVLFTDMFVTSKEEGEELMDVMKVAIKKTSTLHTILSNDDVHNDISKDLFFLPLDLLPIHNHKTFGTTPISTYYFNNTDHDVVLKEGTSTQEFHIPFFAQCSSIKKEGIQGALALLRSEGITPSTCMSQGFPIIESQISDSIEYYWMGEETTTEEIHAVFQEAKHVCIGVSVYLSFEDIIEGYVESLDSILVVAENIAEATLFTEYFVKKEKDSFYSVVYAADKDDLKYLIPPLFEGHKVVYMFGELESFNTIT